MEKNEVIWDENIHIIGGSFDFNKENNTSYEGDIQKSEFIGCGIILNHIKNFTVTNINKLTNAKKYCILYGNALNGFPIIELYSGTYCLANLQINSYFSS